MFQSCILDIPSSGVVHLHEISGKLQYESYRDDENILSYTTKETGEDEVYQDFKRIGKSINLALEKAYMRQEDFVRLIKKVTLPLQKN